MTDAAPRISPAEVRRKKAGGESTLLVCAYESPEKCSQVKLDGSIDFKTLQAKLPSLSKDQEIVLYCA